MKNIVDSFLNLFLPVAFWSLIAVWLAQALGKVIERVVDWLIRLYYGE